MIDYYLLGPIHELELPDRPRGSVTSVCDFELSQQVLGHIVLSQWVNHKTLENIQFEVKYLLSVVRLKGVIKHSLYLPGIAETGHSANIEHIFPAPSRAETAKFAA